MEETRKEQTDMSNTLEQAVPQEAQPASQHTAKAAASKPTSAAKAKPKTAPAKASGSVKKPASTKKPASATSSVKGKASTPAQPDKAKALAKKKADAAKAKQKARAQAKKAEAKAKKEREKAQLTPKQRKAQRKKRLRLIGKIVRRTLLFLIVVLVALFLGVYAMLKEVFQGPSQTAGDMLTLTMFETSALKFVPRLYYDEDEIAALQDRNKLVELTQETDTSLIVINKPASGEVVAQTVEDDGFVDGIKLEEVRGATYRGFMLTVLDPSRVSLGVSSDYFSDSRSGMKIQEIAKKYDAIAAINGGAFSDPGGQGNGGMPNGLTVSEGKIRNASGGGDLITVGFDENNVLIVGKMNRSQATEKGIRDAASFGPALVVNGEGAKVAGVSSGLNPRTAIGQRADGAVLMLVIDGRQVNSMGASMADLVDIMLKYGAVNACNLDGGSSSNMIYNGEMINDGVSVTGSRAIPTAFIVR